MIALNPVVESSELIHVTYTSAPRLPLLWAHALTRSACYNADSDRGFLMDMCVVLAPHLLALLLSRQRSSTAGCSMSFPRSWQKTAGDSSRRKREICISPRCRPQTWAATCAKWRTLWPTPGSWAHRRLWLSKQMVRYYTHFTHIWTHTHSYSLNPITCTAELGWMPSTNLGELNWWINTMIWSLFANIKLRHYFTILAHVLTNECSFSWHKGRYK